MTSSYFSDHSKEFKEDLLFLNADLFEEQQEAMYETDPSDWTGVIDAEPREDALIGRLDEL